MANTLYGGPTGSSMVIKASYKSVQAMVDAFKNGPTYTVCGYGEYCIVDTPNKNSAENGLIFQRGVNYNDKQGGAIRIGQIVGPSSGTPYFQIGGLDEVAKQAGTEIDKANTANNIGHVRYPTNKNNGIYEVVSKTAQDFKGTNKPDLSKELYAGEFDSAPSLVPGKNGNTFNDSIKYTWCNIRLDNADSDSWFYVGFQIPYLVNDFTVNSVSPYDENKNRVDKISATKDPEFLKTVVNEDGKTITLDEWLHPFYNKWNLGIPKGIKGDTLRNLKVIDGKKRPAGYENIYKWTAFETNEKNDYQLTLKTNLSQDDIYTCKHEGIDGQSRKILVFDILTYDKRADAEGSSYHIYLGDYNMVENINLADDGTLTIKYSHENSGTNSDGSAYPKIRWIDNVTLNNSGQFVINFNTTVPKADGYVSPGFWADGPNKLGFQLDWITNILINEETGDIGLVHADESKNENSIFEENDAKKISAKLKIITKATTSADGVTTLYFNTKSDGESYDKINLEDAARGGDYHLRIIEDAKINKGILEDKRIQLGFNSPLTTNTQNAEKVSAASDNNYYYIGAPINGIAKMAIRATDWHLFVLYSDPNSRFVPFDVNNVTTDPNNFDYELPVDTNNPKLNWVRRTYNQQLESYTYLTRNGEYWNTNISSYSGDTVTDKSLFWQDLGSIKDDAGLMVGLNLTKSDIPSEWVVKGSINVIDYLNNTYPTGLTGMSNSASSMPLAGKMVTYSENSGDDKKFYAFNYGYGDFSTPQGWYYLGTLSKTAERDTIYYPMTWEYPPKPELEQLKSFNMVAENGIAFFSRPTLVSKNSIPRMWAPDYVEV